MWNPFKKKRKPTTRRVSVKQAKDCEGMISVSLSYANYVLPADKALQLMNLVAKAEIYEDVFHPELNGNHADKYTHHVYPNEKTAAMKMMPDAFYNMAKLAGKPEKK